MLQNLTSCSVITVTRGKKIEHGIHYENGVDAGLTAVGDIELLALGDHIIGTFGSTFTLLIQALIAHRYIQSQTAKPEGRETKQDATGDGERTAMRMRREEPTTIHCESNGCMRPLSLIADWHVSLQRWPSATYWVG